MKECRDERLLDRREVEERFGITKRFLEIAVMRGDGPPFVRLGRLIRYRPADIRRWIDDNTVSEGR